MPRVSSNPTTSSSSSSESLRLGPIVGGVVAVFALVLLFIFLLLKHRASRKIRSRAEIDPTLTPFDHVDTREGLGRLVSVNDDGSRSKLPRPTGALCFVLAGPVILTTHRFL